MLMQQEVIGALLCAHESARHAAACRKAQVSCIGDLLFRRRMVSSLLPEPPAENLMQTSISSPASLGTATVASDEMNKKMVAITRSCMQQSPRVNWSC